MKLTITIQGDGKVLIHPGTTQELDAFISFLKEEDKRETRKCWRER